MLNRTARYLLAAIQAIIGWEWIMSGCNKILSGNFPQGLSDALNFSHWLCSAPPGVPGQSLPPRKK
jgi:hypothetical protein